MKPESFAGPATGALDGAEHVYRLRVYYEDTDAAGVVYYANYLRMAERARTEMMRLLGADHAEMARTENVALAVRDCSIAYLKPAYLDDVLEIRTRLTEIGGASLKAQQSFHRAGETLATIDLRLACIADTGRPARFPRSFRAALDAFDAARSSVPTQRA